MTDKEVVKLLLEKCVIILDKSNHIIQKYIENRYCEIFNISPMDGNTFDNISYWVNGQYILHSEDKVWMVTNLSYRNIHYRETLLLFQDEVLYLLNMYDENVTTKESLRYLLSSIDIRERLRHKDILLKQLWKI